MNLRDLRYLAALDAERHFGRAAARAHVSQPTLSAQIRKLEDELGVALFERGGRRVVPTEAGAAVLAQARDILRREQAIRDIAQTFRDPLAGRFRLGVIASLGPFIAGDLMAKVKAAAPDLTLMLREALTSELLAALDNWDLDAALIATAPPDDALGELALFEEPFLLAHAPNDALAALERPSADALAAGRLLLLSEGHCLRDQALSLCGSGAADARVEATSLFTLMRLAADGQGATLVPALAAPQAGGLMLRPLAEARASRRVRLVFRHGHPRGAALAVLAEAAKAVARDRGLDSDRNGPRLG